MAQKIAFFDIDGTLLSFRTHSMPHTTQVALQELRKNNVLIYVASGRALFQVPSFLRNGQGDFEGFDGFLCNSGQVCLDERGIFRMTAVDPEAVRLITEEALKGGFDIVYMTADRAFTPRHGPLVTAAEEHANVKFDEDVPEAAYARPVYQLNAFIAPEDEHLITDVTDKVKLVRWTEDFADVIPADGGKDQGVWAVLDHYGIDRKDAYAFGDGGNDASMLAAVGNGVAMGNADHRAKDVANVITTSVDDAGIYRACVHLGLIDDVLHMCEEDRCIMVIKDGKNK